MKLFKSGVSPATGQSALTRMPSGASSTAIVLVAVIIQPLDALYQFSRGRGLSPAVEAMLRIAPRPAAFNARHDLARGEVDGFHVHGEDAVEIGLGDVFHERGKVG